MEMTLKIGGGDKSFFDTYIYNPLCFPTESFLAFLKRPWSLVTHLFLESSFWTLLSQMIWLWVFGSVIEDLTGTNRILPLFLVGGIFGGLLHLILGSFLPLQAINYHGSMAGVSAVCGAAMMFKPKYRFYTIFRKGIPLYVFAIIFIALVLGFMTYTKSWSVLIFFAGGMAIGLMHYNVLYGMFSKLNKFFANFRAYFSNNSNYIKKESRPATQSKASNEGPLADIDRILDKINSSGMQSVTKKEKALLEKYGRD